jgi:hypothetical protein
MKLETKYDVGHKFWVPRCYEVWEKEELRFEDEVWYRDVKRLKSFAKCKRIVKIEISVNSRNKSLIMYYVINDNEDENQMSSVHAEEFINDYTEEQAFAVAKEYEAKNETYYGL